MFRLILSLLVLSTVACATTTPHIEPVAPTAIILPDPIEKQWTDMAPMVTTEEVKASFTVADVEITSPSAHDVLITDFEDDRIVMPNQGYKALCKDDEWVCNDSRNGLEARCTCDKVVAIEQ